MRASPLSVIAVVALLLLAGCAGLPGSDEDQPSPDEFPNASDIDQSAFDRHATELANTSFTLSTETNQTDRAPWSDENFTHMNDSARILVEPGASQYLAHTKGHFSGNGTIYSDGSTEYMLPQGADEPTVRKLSPAMVFNESSDRYLWGGWFDNDSENQLAFAAIDASYQREGVETFQGVPVMRYEATGADALPDWMGGENASSHFEEFSATLLLDEDGVIRHYEYEFVWADYQTRRIAQTYTLSDVGSTDVQKPDWVADAASNTTSGA